MRHHSPQAHPKAEAGMTPELLAVLVVEHVGRSGVAFAGRLRAETFTMTSRPDTLARSVETPAQATD